MLLASAYSPVLSFETLPTVPGTPQPPVLSARSRNSLKVRDRGTAALQPGGWRTQAKWMHSNSAASLLRC